MKGSLERIVKLSPEQLACGHGLPIRFENALPIIMEYSNCFGKETDHMTKETVR
jgi:hypothetical protein